MSGFPSLWTALPRPASCWKDRPERVANPVGSHTSSSVRSVMGGGHDQALEPGRQRLAHDGLLVIDKDGSQSRNRLGDVGRGRQRCGAQHDSAAWDKQRSTAQHAAGAFGHRRGSRQKPIEGLGLTRAETLVSAASAGLAGVEGCRDTTLNPFHWTLCSLLWVASHEISNRQPFAKKGASRTCCNPLTAVVKKLIVDKHA
ncbi:hypothetical protein V8C35DRAFT_156858 [Trichoderma chlorosporum]